MLEKIFEKAALFISHILSPPLVAFAVLLYAIFEEKVYQNPHFNRALIYSIVIIFLLPLGYTLVLKRLKLISNFFYSQKKERIYLFPLIIAVLVAMMALVPYYQASTTIMKYLQVSTLLFLFIAIITPIIKVSLHMSGLTSLFIIMLWLWGGKSLWFAFLLPPVAWSRLYLNQHTALQIVSGTFIGGFGTLLYIYLTK